MVNRQLFRSGQAATVALLLGLLAGCGQDGPPLGTVTGTVTLDGKPVADARILFQPAEGSPSLAITDDRGNYNLAYAPGKFGAMLGEHQVQITTGGLFRMPDGTEQDRKEILPDSCHSNSALVRTVEPGANVIDFEIRSGQ